jgi:hypothetical protein
VLDRGKFLNRAVSLCLVVALGTPAPVFAAADAGAPGGLVQSNTGNGDPVVTIQQRLELPADTAAGTDPAPTGEPSEMGLNRRDRSKDGDRGGDGTETDLTGAEASGPKDQAKDQVVQGKEKTESEDDGMSDGEMAGIAVLATAGLIGVAALMNKKKKGSGGNANNGNNGGPGGGPRGPSCGPGAPGGGPPQYTKEQEIALPKDECIKAAKEALAQGWPKDEAENSFEKDGNKIIKPDPKGPETAKGKGARTPNTYITQATTAPTAPWEADCNKVTYSKAKTACDESLASIRKTFEEWEKYKNGVEKEKILDGMTDAVKAKEPVNSQTESYRRAEQLTKKGQDGTAYKTTEVHDFCIKSLSDAEERMGNVARHSKERAGMALPEAITVTPAGKDAKAVGAEAEILQDVIEHSNSKDDWTITYDQGKQPSDIFPAQAAAREAAAQHAKTLKTLSVVDARTAEIVAACATGARKAFEELRSIANGTYQAAGATRGLASGMQGQLGGPPPGGYPVNYAAPPIK